MKKNPARSVLLSIDLFVAITTMAGAIWVVPSLPRSWLSFFPDYTIPAVGLGLVSLVSWAAALTLVTRQRVGAELSVIAGAAMAFFEVVEAIAAGNLLNPPPGTASGGPLWLQPFYFVVGAFMVILGIRLWRQASPRESWTSRLRHPLAAA